MAIYKISTAKVSGHPALKAILRYVWNEEKTPSRLHEVTGYFEKEEITASTVFDSFTENKRSWHKDTGRMYTHAIIFFIRMRLLRRNMSESLLLTFPQKPIRGIGFWLLSMKIRRICTHT